jgi:hypothetical protein
VLAPCANSSSNVLVKIRQNDPCPCGSGKKYKQCCGSAHVRAPRQPQEVTSFQAPPGSYVECKLPMALHGQNQYVLFRPKYSPADDPRNSGSPEGEPGLYRVVFTFARPGLGAHPEGKYTVEQYLEGDSHLYIRLQPNAQKIVFALGTSDGIFEFYGVPNSRGCLGKIIAETVSAENFHDAERKAWAAICPALSAVSLHLDIPFQVDQVDIVERRTGAFMLKVLLAYRNVGLGIGSVLNGSPEFRFHASLYREAINNAAPLYQFLCLYKIIDAIYARRQRILRELKFQTPPRVLLTETVPNDPTQFKVWMDCIFPQPARLSWQPMHFESVFRTDVRGKEFTDIATAYLTPIRNRIAHAITGTSELGFSIDDVSELQTVLHWLPLVKCIVRRMLRNEFPDEFMPGWREDGTFDESREATNRRTWTQVFGTAARTE